ncbi:MAG: hypothetical protein VR70_02480 [Rhodospirillaceae bacterium BRH_c57]|nr:MAG: hypothetical protein VR70_02480 [Rhodospirillaceae bacterium BRH_c57]
MATAALDEASHYVSPAQRHAGQDQAILGTRHDLYQKAREANPLRWTGNTRDWKPVGAVTLNPERDSIIQACGQATGKTLSMA